jgi:sec-independent protein translocase protein TatB
MFGIDFSEILVIFGIALVVLGPEKLPRLAATIGRWVGRARAMARQFREQLEQEAETIRRTADLKTQQSSPMTPRPPIVTTVPEPDATAEPLATAPPTAAPPGPAPAATPSAQAHEPGQ